MLLRLRISVSFKKQRKQLREQKMETHKRILSMKMYQSGDHFDAWTVAQRLGLPINKVRHACDRLVQNTLLVKHVREKEVDHVQSTIVEQMVV